MSWNLKRVDVRPPVGFCDVRLGMDRKMVSELLGQPDETEVESFFDGASTGEFWEYKSYGFTLCFSSDDDFLLGTATFERSEHTLLGLTVIGLSSRELMALGSEGLLPEVVLEQDFPELDSASYKCKDYEIAFWLSGSIWL